MATCDLRLCQHLFQKAHQAAALRQRKAVKMSPRSGPADSMRRIMVRKLAGSIQTRVNATMMPVCGRFWMFAVLGGSFHAVG